MSPKLPTRQLGKDGPQVAALGYGLMPLSIFYAKKLPDEERLKVLDHAADLGTTFWDSSDVYGDNEDLIGEWFKRTGRRNEIFLCTKFGMSAHPSGGASIVRNDPEYIKEACAKSLKRLGLPAGDSIDLYYCHRLDPKQPVEVTVKAMAELVKEGKVKHIGLSECSAESLRRAYKVHPIAAVQVEYSPFALDIENNGLLETARELGVAVIAYSPLSRGFLTGSLKSYDDFEESDRRRALPRFSKENFSKNLELVHVIQQLAEKKGCTSGQLTMAWLMAQGEDIIPIPGTTKTKNLDENVGSVSVSLTKADIDEIRKAVDSTEILGDRYPANMLSNLYVDTVPL